MFHTLLFQCTFLFQTHCFSNARLISSIFVHEYIQLIETNQNADIITRWINKRKDEPVINIARVRKHLQKQSGINCIICLNLCNASINHVLQKYETKEFISQFIHEVFRAWSPISKQAWMYPEISHSKKKLSTKRLTAEQTGCMQEVQPILIKVKTKEVSLSIHKIISKNLRRFHLGFWTVSMSCRILYSTWGGNSSVSSGTFLNTTA